MPASPIFCRTITSIVGGTSSVTVTLPTVFYGDKIYAWIAVSNGQVGGYPSGWFLLFAKPSGYRLYCVAKYANGTEGGTTATFTTSITGATIAVRLMVLGNTATGANASDQEFYSYANNSTIVIGGTPNTNTGGYVGITDGNGPNGSHNSYVSAVVAAAGNAVPISGRSINTAGYSVNVDGGTQYDATSGYSIMIITEANSDTNSPPGDSLWMGSLLMGNSYSGGWWGYLFSHREVLSLTGNSAASSGTTKGEGTLTPYTPRLNLTEGSVFTNTDNFGGYYRYATTYSTGGSLPTTNVSQDYAANQGSILAGSPNGALIISYTGPNGFVYALDPIPCTIGHTYRTSMVVYNVSGTPRLAAGPSGGSATVSGGFDSWQLVQSDWTATASSHTLVLFNENMAGTVAGQANYVAAISTEDLTTYDDTYPIFNGYMGFAKLWPGQVLQSGTGASSSASNTLTVNFNQTATVGSTIIIAAAGNGFTTPSGYTAYNSGYLTFFVKTAAGNETSISLTATSNSMAIDYMEVWGLSSAIPNQNNFVSGSGSAPTGTVTLLDTVDNVFNIYSLSSYVSSAAAATAASLSSGHYAHSAAGVHSSSSITGDNYGIFSNWDSYSAGATSSLTASATLSASSTAWVLGFLSFTIARTKAQVSVPNAQWAGAASRSQSLLGSPVAGKIVTTETAKNSVATTIVAVPSDVGGTFVAGSVSASGTDVGSDSVAGSVSSSGSVIGQDNARGTATSSGTTTGQDGVLGVATTSGSVNGGVNALGAAIASSSLVGSNFTSGTIVATSLVNGGDLVLGTTNNTGTTIGSAAPDAQPIVTNSANLTGSTSVLGAATASSIPVGADAVSGTAISAGTVLGVLYPVNNITTLSTTIVGGEVVSQALVALANIIGADTVLGAAQANALNVVGVNVIGRASVTSTDTATDFVTGQATATGILIGNQTPQWFLWDGNTLLPMDIIGIWDGSLLQGVDFLGAWDGSQLQP